MSASVKKVLAAVTVGIAMAATASAAQASIVLSSNGPFSDPDVVNVSGSSGDFPAGTTHVSIAECNVDVTPGTRCNASTGIAFGSASTYSSTGFNLTVDQSFTDFNFITGAPSSPFGVTDCLGVGTDQCGVLVAYYEETAPNVYDHLGVDPDSGDTPSLIEF